MSNAIETVNPSRTAPATLRDWLMEFCYFTVKEALACVFAGSFFLAVMLLPRAGFLGVPRYDLLLVIALAIQAAMVWSGWETKDELKAISLFHLLGIGLVRLS